MADDDDDSGDAVDDDDDDDRDDDDDDRDDDSDDDDRDDDDDDCDDDSDDDSDDDDSDDDSDDDDRDAPPKTQHPTHRPLLPHSLTPSLPHQQHHGHGADELVHPLVGDDGEGRRVVEHVVVLVHVPASQRQRESE